MSPKLTALLHSVKSSSKLWRWVSVLATPVGLVLAWFLVFGDHLLEDVGFPWDFMLGYHASTFYVIESLKSGEFPQWVPFQAMGYPLPMNVQSGLFYPVNWLLAACDFTYTMKTAIVTQCLHVLFGMFGMVYLAAKRGASKSAAFLCGLAFLFFGGFYSNAQHVDIIRMYAWAPYLFAAFTFVRKPSRVDLALIPVIVYGFITASYPGGMMANLFLAALYWFFQLVSVKFWQDWAHVRLAILVGILAAIGVGMAAAFLITPFAMRHELVRSYIPFNEMSFWQPRYFFTLFTNYSLPHLKLDVSMCSGFVGVPAVVGLFLMDMHTLKRHWPLLVTGIISGLMISGTFLFKWVTALIPVLSLSRFPASDFRIAIAITAIMIGMFSLEQLARLDRIRYLPFFVKLIVVNALVIYAAQHMYKAYNIKAIALIYVLLATDFVLVIIRLTAARWRIVALVTALVTLVPLDATRILQPELRTWFYRNLSAHYHDSLGFPVTQLGDSLASVLTEPKASRPGRDDTIQPLLVSIRGYLTGEYQMHDYSCGQKMTNYVKIMADPQIKKYMQQPLHPIVVPVGTELRTVIDQPADYRGFVEPILYGTNRISYKVNLNQAMVLLENEIFFEGWTGEIENPVGENITVEPERVLKALRSWRLPAGNYQFNLTFRTPYLRQASYVSLTFALLWLMAIGLLIAIRSRRTPVNPNPIPSGLQDTGAPVAEINDDPGPLAADIPPSDPIKKRRRRRKKH
ncbi:MAG: hypothetical protein KDC35_20850 [Acidobacteria bacterium]|nr:hypothetical protein [Acidobacteriota bacterium]